jgi:hypothetical protein
MLHTAASFKLQGTGNGPLLARLRLRALAAASPLIVAELTFKCRCPLFQTIGLHAEVQPTWFDSCTWSHVDSDLNWSLQHMH